jgi:hypothetical protein
VTNDKWVGKENLVEFVVELRKLGDILHNIFAHEKGRSHGDVTLGLENSQCQLDQSLEQM